VDISVVLCTYNRASTLKSTLESFAGLTLRADLDWELVVVDNNSNDSTAEVIGDFTKTAGFCVRSVFEARQGRSAALNTGIVAARGKIVAFTDDDVLLHSEWLLTLKRAFDEFDCAGAGGRIIPVWRHQKPDWLEMEDQQAIVHYDLGDETKEIKDSPPLGANSAYRKDAFAKYGGFRLDLGVCGESRGVTCEDTEFASRLFRAREKIMYVPSAVIYHPVDPARCTKAYFRKWYYNDGRSMIRVSPAPESFARYFGIPRWIFRSLGENFLQWMFSFDGKRRLHFKVRTYRDVGKIVESYRLSHTVAMRSKG
jgi:glycosyltransferase involved in cell wall biosynthesis